MGLSGTKHVPTPIYQAQNLTTTEFDKYIPPAHEDLLLKDPTSYQKFIGRLLYLTTTRPDIAFSAALRLVRYVKHAPGLGILMSATGDDLLRVYCDADWGACVNSRRSITGYLVHYGNSPISWRSKKQATVSRSSTEAKYRAMASSVAEVVWITGLFKQLGVDIKMPVTLFSDRKSAL
ncbi:uncharacterized mitochondrial protein AtMg00810-like [Solanum dulcamara]|uniref:uncharacterized mitochondrial protein AtMg00810-like n=1 Tax=Solanum dulcamara TaxID=45834 RepID=UPI002486B847|nr:uncharacterized mitochondrial protein AtMg00810-like [Solanum dulcamara]